MNETTPLKIDLRLALESLSSGLAFLLVGIAAINLVDPYNILVPLLIGGVIVTVNRILGKSVADGIAELRDSINRLIISNNVLKADATPTVIRQADEAAKAVGIKKEESK